MKRPRRPTKKTARKIVRKKRQTKAQKAAQAEAELRASLRQIDPFYLDPKLIPIGWGYAWKANQRPGGQLPMGWSLVPYSRHAHDFPASYDHRGFIAHDGLILAEATVDQISRESITPIREAMAMRDNHPAAMQRDDRGRYVGRMQIMPEDWLETEKIPREAAQNEGPPVEVVIDLKLRVPVRWRNAALFMKLPLEEYVRRRIVMECPILGCVDPFPAEAVYEPVNLQFTTIHSATKES